MTLWGSEPDGNQRSCGDEIMLSYSSFNNFNSTTTLPNQVNKYQYAGRRADRAKQSFCRRSTRPSTA